MSGTELIISPLTNIVVTKSFELILKKLNKITKKNKLLDIQCSYDRAISIENVKTIWQIDKSVNLNEFYYDTSIYYEEKVVKVQSLNDFYSGYKYVIEGIAGQGKSIFLRYLAGKELRGGKKIPIFIELRKVNNNNSLESLLTDAINNLGLSIKCDDLDSVFKSNDICLLLDAFDELSEPYIIDTISYIENICSRFNNLQIIVTSMPGSAISHVSFFKVCRIKKLTGKDIEPILNKLINNDDVKVNLLIDSIEKSSIEVKKVLNTPLMVTLLVLIYRSYNKIPETLHEFYRGIFDTLVSRHDETKPGFKRLYKSGLNRYDLERIFCAFSFYSMLGSNGSFSYNEAIEFVKAAKNATLLTSFKEDDFLDDCCKNTCLILKEGFDYHYIHKSIMEYHSAVFISTSPDLLKQRFYSAAYNSSMNMNNSFINTLNFLKFIDEYCFNKYFLIKKYEKLFSSLKVNSKNRKILDDKIIFDGLSITFDANKNVNGFGYASKFLKNKRKNYFFFMDSYFDLSNCMISVMFKYIRNVHFNNIIKQKYFNQINADFFISIYNHPDIKVISEKILDSMNLWILNHYQIYLNLKKSVRSIEKEMKLIDERLNLYK